MNTDGASNVNADIGYENSVGARFKDVELRPQIVLAEIPTAGVNAWPSQPAARSKKSQLTR